MSIFIWNLVAAIGTLLIVFPIAIIYEKRDKLRMKRLKIYLLIIMEGVIFMIISTCELEIFYRLVIGTLCLSPLLLIGLVSLVRLFKKIKKQEKEDHFTFT